MYKISFVNLTADARSAANSVAPFERSDLTDAELRTLLQSFGEIDAVQNAVAEPEIRVKVRNESYLIRTGQKKFMLYDVSRRDQPALVLTLAELMAELDGSALAARNSSSGQSQLAALETPAPLPLPVHPVVKASRPRLAIMGAVALGLLGAIIIPALPLTGDAPVGFVPVESTELAGLQASLTGVYLTGNEPGQHGIVVAGPGELKLFELGAVEAPRVVYASYTPGRIGRKLCLATDQPGGMIEVSADGALVYCGETYQRIP